MGRIRDGATRQARDLALVLPLAAVTLAIWLGLYVKVTVPLYVWLFPGVNPFEPGHATHAQIWWFIGMNGAALIVAAWPGLWLKKRIKAMAGWD